MPHITYLRPGTNRVGTKRPPSRTCTSRLLAMRLAFGQMTAIREVVRSRRMSNFERTTLTENEMAARWEMFGPPPVLSSENKEGYYNLRNGCVAYYRPTDARHWSWIRELVDT